MEKELLTELHELNSTLANFKKSPSNFAKKERETVPNNYFDSLTECVLLQSELENDSEILASLPKKVPLKQSKQKKSLASDYFSTLNQTVLLQVELENNAPILADLSKKTQKQRFYEAKPPSNFYFESLCDAVLAKAKTSEVANETTTPHLQLVKSTTKTTSLVKRFSVGFAAAAMLAGSFFYFNNQSIKEVENEAESIFSSISYNEATEYADEHVYEIDEALLLDHSKSLKIHQLMDVSHGEIQHYLDETGGTLED